MTLLEALLLGLAIGAVLGALGGGGAVLTVPALVYVLGQPAQDATTGSLVVVGLTAVVGAASYVVAGRVCWRTGLGFGLAGVPAAYAGSRLNHHVDGNVLLLGFSVLMVVAAAAMLAERRRCATAAATPEPVHLAAPAGREVGAAVAPPVAGVVLAGLAVGLLTGFFGVGGGFVIVPALVLALRLPMQQAVGTSLLVVAMNSATSLASRLGTAHLDWAVVVPFTLAAMVATLVGKHVADRLPAHGLKAGFAVLLVLVAGYTAWQSVLDLTA